MAPRPTSGLLKAKFGKGTLLVHAAWRLQGARLRRPPSLHALATGSSAL